MALVQFSNSKKWMHPDQGTGPRPWIGVHLWKLFFSLHCSNSWALLSWMLPDQVSRVPNQGTSSRQLDICPWLGLCSLIWIHSGHCFNSGDGQTYSQRYMNRSLHQALENLHSKSHRARKYAYGRLFSYLIHRNMCDCKPLMNICGLSKKKSMTPPASQ